MYWKMNIHCKAISEVSVILKGQDGHDVTIHNDFDCGHKQFQ